MRRSAQRFLFVNSNVVGVGEEQDLEMEADMRVLIGKDNEIAIYDVDNPIRSRDIPHPHPQPPATSNNAIPAVDANLGSCHESRCITRKEHDRSLSVTSVCRSTQAQGHTYRKVLWFTHLSNRVSSIHVTQQPIPSPCPLGSDSPMFSIAK